jgi:hypothetical protein
MKNVLTVTDREGIRVISAEIEARASWTPDPAAGRPRAEVFQIDAKAKAGEKRVQMRFSPRRNVITWPKRPEASAPHPDAA